MFHVQALVCKQRGPGQAGGPAGCRSRGALSGGAGWAGPGDRRGHQKAERGDARQEGGRAQLQPGWVGAGLGGVGESSLPAGLTHPGELRLIFYLRQMRSLFCECFSYIRGKNEE